MLSAVAAPRYASSISNYRASLAAHRLASDIALAQATARATDDIAGKIDAIQTTTREASEAISEISVVVSEINGFQTSIEISSAVQSLRL